MLCKGRVHLLMAGEAHGGAISACALASCLVRRCSTQLSFSLAHMTHSGHVLRAISAFVDEVEAERALIWASQPTVRELVLETAVRLGGQNQALCRRPAKRSRPQ